MSLFSFNQLQRHIENHAFVFTTVLGYVESRDEQDLHLNGFTVDGRHGDFDIETEKRIILT